MKNNESAIELLTKYNQEHIIKLLSKLEGNAKQELIEQINNIDLDMLMKLYETTRNNSIKAEQKIEYIEYLDKSNLGKKEKEKFDKFGEKVIKNGEYAVVTMAGGQGTRLGHIGPKGTFKLKVFGQEKSLFEILAENLKEANNKYNVVIPWYIMTSKENHNETYKFLEEHNYFGYDKDNIMLFSQGELALMDTEGKILIRKRFKNKRSF